MNRKQALDFTRVLGRRLIDLTGNGPPTTADRWRQRLRVQPPHPRYMVAGQFFASETHDKKSLTATLVTRPDTNGVLTDMVLVQTITGTMSNDIGVDGDFAAYIDADLLGSTAQSGWTGQAPNKIAQSIAKIGRLLVWGLETDVYPFRKISPTIVLTDEDNMIQPLILFLRGLLAFNGFDQPGQRLDYYAPTPSFEHRLEMIGLNGELHPTAASSILALSQPQIKIVFDGNTLRLRRIALSISLEHMSFADKMNCTRRLLEIFSSKGWREDILSLHKDELSGT